MNESNEVLEGKENHAFYKREKKTNKICRDLLVSIYFMLWHRTMPNYYY